MTEATTSESPRPRPARTAARVLGATVLSAIPVVNIAAVGYVYAAMGAVGEAEGPIASASLAPIHRYLWRGLKGLFGSLLVLAWPSALLFWSWTAGWMFSYEGLDYSWKVLAQLSGLVAGLALAPLLLYLPIAQARFARSGRISSFFHVSEIFALARVRPWIPARCALCVPVQLSISFAARAVLMERFTYPSFAALNLVAYPAYLWIHLHWSRSYHALEGARSAASTPTRAPFPWQWILAIPVALATTWLILAHHFVSSFGWVDFFDHPSFLLPTVPYPVGLWWSPVTL